MERSHAVAWTNLLVAGLALGHVLPPSSSITTSEASPRPPRLTGCVFLNRANITCRWEAGDTPATHYTLQIQKKSRVLVSTPETFICTTSDTSCTADIGTSSVRFFFCITITAHGLSGDVSSDPRCQSGRIEVMLPPVTLQSVKPVYGRPQDLNVTWTRDLALFPVSDSEIKAGMLNSQIEVTAKGQPHGRVRNVTVRDSSFQVSLFRPDTSYTIRLRHRYRGPESLWSAWSNELQGTTAEDAPSVAPAFWRQVKQTDKNGRRLISLLWKALPRFLANGRVLLYNVTCQTDSAQILSDQGSCRDLHDPAVSCNSLLPAERCSCALTASNSAGTSPEAKLWFLEASEEEPPSPPRITANPLDDNSLEVSWVPPADRSVSGFVVEWFAVRQKNSSILHWERLNSSCTTLVITEGVKPMERYAVSVKALYGERGAGKNRTLEVYTRQGVPSAGPNVEVRHISAGTVKFSWSPVPVEMRHGFVRNYTLYYAAANQPARSMFVPGHIHQYSLENLSPGNYDIFMQANTDAGPGATGPIANVHIDSEEISIAMYAILPLMLMLALVACLVQNNTVKEKLCYFIPDPSNSSLAHWTPNTTSSMKQLSVPERIEMNYPEVILLCESELQNSDPNQATSYQSVCNLQVYSSLGYLLPPVSGSQLLQNHGISETKSNLNPVRAEITSNTDLSTCPSIYSTVFPSQTTLFPSHGQSSDFLHGTVRDGDEKLQLGGDNEESPSSVLISHYADVSLPEYLFHQSNFNSVPSLKPDTFTHHSTPSDCFSSFPPLVFVDLSYCPVESDPYTSRAVSFMPRI